MSKGILYKIDCLEAFKNTDTNSVDYVFTSPPYNRKRNDKYAHYDDTKTDYFGFLCEVIDNSIRVAKKHVFFNIMKNYYNKADVFKIIGLYADKIVDVFIWEKTNPLPASGHSITNAYEFFIIFGSGLLKSNNTYTKNIITTSINNDTNKEHKAIMNSKVSDWFIQKFTQENETILDPFMGMGTTAISCIKHNRKYVGFEIDSKYFEASKQRIKDFENNLELDFTSN